MSSFPPTHVGSFDFTEALALPAQERLQRAVEQLRHWHEITDYESFCLFPPIPSYGASQAELDDLEAELEITLPADYRLFLSMWVYIDVDPMRIIWGVRHEGIYITDHPWAADRYPIPGTYLVMGMYRRFARSNSDHLVIKLDVPEQPVLVYLHECGPSLEFYAPNVSLALWRMVHESMQQA
jgi:hypothetical protein